MFSFGDSSTVHYVMINNVYSRFVSGLANYFKNDAFPRINDSVVSTYEKVIEHIRQRKRLGSENWNPKFPFLMIDPQMDISPDDAMGKFYTGYPNFVPKLAMSLTSSTVYDDGNVTISPIVNRYRGTIDMTIYCTSIYELIDNRIQIIQMFGGEQRYIYPKVFEGIIIIPDEFRNYSYSNPYTGDEYILDWDSTTNKSEMMLIKNINDEKLVFPFQIRPLIKLISISDGADKYGGSGDLIGEHKLQFTIEWEASLPTHLILFSHYLPLPEVPLELSFATDIRFYKNPISSEEIYYPERVQSVAHFGNESVRQKHPERLNTEEYGRSGSEKYDLVFDEVFNYVLTEQDIESFNNNENVTISMPKQLLDERFLMVHSRYSWLDRDTQWELDDDKNLVLIWPTLKDLFQKDDIITIFLYKNGD